VAVAAIVAVKSFVIDPLTGHFGGPFEDFAAYLGAARFIARGVSPYAGFNASTVVMTGFDYPPFAAVMVEPLARLSDHAAMVVWLWLSLACTIAGAVIVARTALPRSWPAVEIGLLAALIFAPATYNYWHGQMNPVIFLLLAIAFWAYVRDREVTAGVMLGLAAGIKIAPVVLVVVLLRRHWWRGTAAMIASGSLSMVVAVGAIGLGPTTTFITRVLPDLLRATGWVYNQSLGGAISRLANHSVLLVQPTAPLIQVGNTAAGLVVVGLAAWATRPGQRPREVRGAEFGLGVMAMLLAGGIAWFPHFVHLLIPLAAVLGLVAVRGLRAELALAISAAVTLIVFGVVVPAVLVPLTVGWLASASQTGLWWPLLQLFSIPCFAALWLALALARSLRRSGPDGEAVAPAQAGGVPLPA
jgi:alpha-1,2-mannosyltransferase